MGWYGSSCRGGEVWFGLSQGKGKECFEEDGSALSQGKGKDWQGKGRFVAGEREGLEGNVETRWSGWVLARRSGRVGLVGVRLVEVGCAAMARAVKDRPVEGERQGLAGQGAS